MNKNKETKARRAAYIKEIVNNSSNAAQAIKNLAQSLFLSEKTITRDLLAPDPPPPKK